MKTYFVDSFTSQPFKGNPAAVCFPDTQLPQTSMLKIAQEFGLSETAFVTAGSQADTYAIRYFSPKKEIPLCGHATLAAAKIIFKDAAKNGIHFITGENIDLHISRRGDEIVMQFPVYDTIPATVPDTMLAALGIAAVTKIAFSEKNKIILIEINDAAILAALQPDFNALLASYKGINGVLVTAPSDDKIYDFHYRYFWPWAGTNEDPVTGGVQTFLAKYWGIKLGKTIMRAFQSSARTGYMSLELKDAKVLLTSHAVIITEGELLVFE